MASITSSSFEHSLADIGGSVDLEGYAVDSVYVFALASPGLAGSVTLDDVREVIVTDFDGVIEGAFSDLFYNQIWIIEKHTQLGNVTANQARIIEVWNAFFVDQTLDGFTSTGDIVVTGFTDGVFNPLESHLYSVTIPLDGAPSINATITWTFEDIGDLLATIRGERVIPFILRHNWTDKVLEQLSFKTDVIPALSGKEQRIGLRRLPRRRFEMSYMTLTPLERAYLENVTYGWQGRRFAVPLWSDVTRLRTTVSEGSDTFDVDTVTRDFDIGSLVFITDGVNHDTLEISGVTDDSITTGTGSLFSYGVGAKVVPARLGTLESKLDLSRITNQLETLRFAWALTADQVSTNRRETYTPVEYRGVELLNVSNDYSNAISIAQNLVQTTMDSDIGQFGNYVGEPFPRRTYPFSQLLTRDELGRFIEWVYQRQGKLTPFWFVERVPSFFLQADVLSDDTTFVVTTGGYTQQAFASTARKDIAINTSAGWKYRRITGATVNEDGTETITLDSALGVDLTAAENPLMSYLKFVRLDQDLVELSYTTTDAISTATAFTDLLTN